MGRSDCHNQEDFLYKHIAGKNCASWAPEKKHCRDRVTGTGKSVAYFCPQQCKKKCMNKEAANAAPVPVPIPFFAATSDTNATESSFISNNNQPSKSKRSKSNSRSSRPSRRHSTPPSD